MVSMAAAMASAPGRFAWPPPLAPAEPAANPLGFRLRKASDPQSRLAFFLGHSGLACGGRADQWDLEDPLIADLPLL
jgi:hypothetical protein